MNVKSYLAGRRGICPNCKGRLVVPLQDQGQAKVGPEDGSDHDQSAARSQSNISISLSNSGLVSGSAAQSGSGKSGSGKSASSNTSAAKTSPRSERPLPDPDQLFDSSIIELATREQRERAPLMPDWSTDHAGATSQSADSRSSHSQAPNSPKAASQKAALQKTAPQAENGGGRTGGSSPNVSAAVAGSLRQSANAQPAAATGAPAARAGTVPAAAAHFEHLDPASFVLDRPSDLADDRPNLHFDWIADAPDAVWYVRHRSGAQYGPALAKQMRVWVSEGRVPVGSFVWCEGWANWRQAADVFPQIVASPPGVASPDQSQQRRASRAAVAGVAVGGAAVSQSAAWSGHSPGAVPGHGNPAAGPTRPAAGQSLESHAANPAIASPRRSGSTWLFASILAFLAVVCLLVAWGLYQYGVSQNHIAPLVSPGTQADPADTEVVDPFAPPTAKN